LNNIKDSIVSLNRRCVMGEENAGINCTENLPDQERRQDDIAAVAKYVRILFRSEYLPSCLPAAMSYSPSDAAV
jgi:hypothetical protein